MPSRLDEIIHRLQNAASWNVYQVDPVKGDVSPWYEVTQGIISDLIVQEAHLRTQVEVISAQIQYWGRLTAQTKRVWEIEERDFRIWKAQRYLEIATPPKGDGAKGWKKPTEETIKAMIRVIPEYRDGYARVERAEEAYNATNLVLEAFRSQKDMLKSAVYKNHEDGAPRLSV